MTNLLIRLFLRDPSETKSSKGRLAYGQLAGGAGLCANILLFIGKLLVGVFTSSMAIAADAFNNLSDAGSSIVTLYGFKMSSAPPDKEHPFGHGRMEYLTAMAVAMMIIVAGFELAKSSVSKIISPTQTEFGWLPAAILVGAIGVKLWMALFYHKIGRIIDSEALLAATADSRNDVICTGVVLLTSLFGWFTHIQIDGWVGAAVALFVIWSGFSVFRDAIGPLLGQAPDPELVGNIKNTVLGHDGIVGVHDVIVHNYGPGRYIVSLHAEVPCSTDMMRSHDLIDRIEKEIMGKYNAIACIHMDPIDTEDERVGELYSLVNGILQDIDPCLNMHDFRVVFGETHTNLIFDIVTPFDYKKNGLADEVQRRIREVNPRLFIVATVENSFT